MHEWVQFKIEYNSYYKNKGFLRLGAFFEGVFSTQSLFNNYTASVLRAPAFQPNPESKTLFLESFRAHKYAAVGKRIVFHLKKNLDLRLEGYLFSPYQSIIKQDTSFILGNEFEKIYSIGTATLVYHSPLGPLSINMNYYHNIPEIAQESKMPLSFFFHFGYILFNKSALE
jgi:NTE family protein